MKAQSLPVDVHLALKAAARSPGWNCRAMAVTRFKLENRYGREPCLLFVVPYRCWVENEIEDQGAAA